MVQAPTCTVADAATTCSNTAGAATSFTGGSGSATGDVLQFQSVPTGTPAAATAGFGARFIPAAAGTFPLMSVFGVTGNTGTPSYYPMTGIGGGTSEPPTQTVTHAMTISSMSVRWNSAPGAAASGKSWTAELRKNGVTVGPPCVVLETAVANTCAISPAVSFVDGDLAGTKVTPAGTPTTSIPSISYLANR